MIIAVENIETRNLNLGQLLYNNEHVNRIIAIIEKLNKKLVLNPSGVLFNKVCILYVYIYIYIYVMLSWRMVKGYN